MKFFVPPSHAVAWLMLCVCGASFAQRPLCSQLSPAERDRARAAGSCRDPAPIIDVPPRVQPEPPVALLPVPSVVGLAFDDASARLKRFTLQRSYRAAAEPGGTVLAQSPMAPATLPANAPVSLVLSDGSLVRIPRVTGININEARQRLQKDLDLKAQPVVVTSDLRVGSVIEQEPAEGTLVKRGSVVRLQVSAGQEGAEMIDVPNVVGMPFDRAKARLARFTVERVDKPHSAPAGQIVEQAPRAATRAAAGSVIQLAVASAPRATVEIFEMPNVIGRRYADAARVLTEFKVGRTETDNSAPHDQIVAQTPAAGSTLMPGDAVTLQVSAGPNASPATAAKAAPAAANASPAAPATAKSTGAGAVLNGVLAISVGVILGLIVGALWMRQWLNRQRAVAAADSAITSLSPHGITAVDILLEDEAVQREPDSADSK